MVTAATLNVTREMVERGLEENRKAFLDLLCGWLGITQDEKPAIPGRQWRSLSIGLNRIDTEAWGNPIDPATGKVWDGYLSSCENDAREFTSILSRCNRERLDSLRHASLLGSAATLAMIRGGIERLGAALLPEERWAIFVSSHGTQVADQNNDEDDRRDEALVVRDGLLLDDTLRSWIDESIPAGNPGALVIDACHSHGISKLMPEIHADGRAAPVIRAAAPPKSAPSSIASGLTHSAIPKASPAPRPMGPPVIELTACASEEVAYAAAPGEKLSQFTRALVETWDDGAFGGDWHRLLAGVVKRVRTPQTPCLAGPRELLLERVFR